MINSISKIQKIQEKEEAMMNMEYSRQKEEGIHRPHYGSKCKCFDCLMSNEQKIKEQLTHPF